MYAQEKLFLGAALLVTQEKLVKLLSLKSGSRSAADTA